MKTKVRTIDGGYNNRSDCRNYEIQILDKRYPSFKDTTTLTVIGSITFQTDRAHEQTPYPWYGLTYVINTDDPEHIAKMAKLARFIKTNTDSSNPQPQDILLIIGAELHLAHRGDFIPESYRGMKYYKVFRNGAHYRSIIAASDTIANKMLITSEGESALFDHIIP